MHRRLTFFCGLFITAALLGVAGCASLDPKPDIDRAAKSVTDRTGVAITWGEPSTDRPEVWNGVSPLSVDQALMIALSNSREIRSEVELIAAGRADLVQAGLLPNPVLSLTMRFPFDPVEGGTFVGVSLVEQFTTLWLRGPRMRAADARLNQTVLTVSDKALRLAADVKSSHARLVYGQRGVALTEKSLDMLHRSVEALQGRVDAGEGTSLDVRRGRQRLAALQSELVRQQRDLASERRRLLELMGLATADADWLASDNGDLPRPILPSDLTEDAVMKLAVGQRLDVAASRELADASAADLTEQERSRLSDLAAGVDFERDVDGAKTIGPTFDIQIPIFDFNQARIARAGSVARSALDSFEAATQQAVSQARVAYIETTATAQLATTYRDEVLSLAEGNIAPAEGALRAGEADVTVLLDAQNELIEARKALNDLDAEAALARIALEYAVGGRLATPSTDAQPAPSAAGQNSDTEQPDPPSHHNLPVRATTPVPEALPVGYQTGAGGNEPGPCGSKRRKS